MANMKNDFAFLLASFTFAILWRSGSGWQQQNKKVAATSDPSSKGMSSDGGLGSSLVGSGLTGLTNADPHLLRKMMLESEAAARARQRTTGSSSNAAASDPSHQSVGGSGGGLIDISKSSGNMSVLVGKQIILLCQIPNAGNESVSWIRHSDSGILAVDNFLYTTSHRFKVFHANGSAEWKLSINPVQVADSGLYECQISTTPHTSHFIAINVVEPRTSILGNRELFIEAGSTINLTCVIQADSMRDSHIYWNYNGKIIAYDRRRGGTIVIDKRPGGQTVTSLIISQADPNDSGTYTCDPASAYSKNILVHVTTGSDAAMRPNAIVRSGSTPSILRPHSSCWLLQLLLFLTMSSSHLLLISRGGGGGLSTSLFECCSCWPTTNSN